MESVLLDLLDKTENRFKRYKKVESFNWNKLKIDCEPGDKIEIVWDKKQYDYTDFGYVIALPGMAIDEGDVFVHIPKPSGGVMDVEPPQWVHLYDLLSNDLVDEIK